MFVAGCGSVWLERLVWDQEVAGSNPVTPILLYLFSKMSLSKSENNHGKVCRKALVIV